MKYPLMTGVLLIGLGVIYGLSYLIQTSLFLNWDVGHLINSTQLLLAGGNYREDFFIPNTPVILHLYIPPLLLHQIFHIDLILSFYIYIYSLISISLIFSYFFLKKIFFREDKEDKRNFYLFFLTLVFAFLCLPLYEFGQRDHLLLILTFPYILAVIHQLEGNPLRFRYLGIGLFAAIGLMIKPQFFILPILIELYVVISKRRFFAWVRPEVIGIIFFTMIYSLIIFKFYPDYIFIITPYLMKYYYQVIGEPWIDLLTNPLMLFFYLVIGLYFISNHFYQKLNTILVIALMGFIFIYLSQRTTFYYHFLPAFTVSLLLVVNLLAEAIYKKKLAWTDYCLWGLIGWTSFIFLVYPMRQVYPLAQYGLLGFYIFIFAFIFYLTCLRVKDFKKIIFFTIMAILLFLFPYRLLAYIYLYDLDYKNNVLHKFAQMMQNYSANRSILALSVHTKYSSPLIYYTNAQLAQRFDCLWMAHRLSKQIAIEGEEKVRQDIRENKPAYSFITMVAEDLRRHQPHLVFVDDTYPNTRFLDKNNDMQRVYIDLLNYFSASKQFSKEWKHYRYLTTLINDPNTLHPFTIRIYQRVSYDQ